MSKQKGGGWLNSSPHRRQSRISLLGLKLTQAWVARICAGVTTMAYARGSAARACADLKCGCSAVVVRL
jgi:hypothetical protein